jgi:N-acetylneuraminate epimerase
MKRTAGWLLTGFLMLLALISNAQRKPRFDSFPSIPDAEGMAGMFAGVSHGSLFCMGGANFPGKKPWEGGKKVWYADIFRFDGRRWHRLSERMPSPLAYGVSVTYKDEVILVGGNDEAAFHAEVRGFRWTDGRLEWRTYPSLPMPLASMAGTRVGSLIIVAGGNTGFTEPPQRSCFALDLEHLSAGWFRLPDIPGLARTQPVAGVYDGAFYLFSGEAPGLDASGRKFRDLQKDAWRLRPVKSDGGWTGVWERLPDMPKAVSASANPVPVLKGGVFVFWGGVDGEIASHPDPATHPGIGRKVMLYDAKSSTWSFAGTVDGLDARVTLPSVRWKRRWVYVSGEIRPGIRTPRNAIVR